MLEAIKVAVDDILGAHWTLHPETTVGEEIENTIDVNLVLQNKRNPEKKLGYKFTVYTNHNLEQQLSMMMLTIYHRDMLSREKL